MQVCCGWKVVMPSSNATTTLTVNAEGGMDNLQHQCVMGIRECGGNSQSLVHCNQVRMGADGGI